MTTVAVLPVKRFTAAKTRLGQDLTAGTRRALAEAMVTDVLIALRRTPEVDAVIVVTGERAAEALAGGYGASVVEDPDDRGHDHAALLGIAEAVESHEADRVLLIAGDCPALDPGELSALLARPAPAPSVLVVPDRHGEGTNALVLSPATVMAPSFGPGSCDRHLDLAARAGATGEVVDVPSLAFDVDTGEDLEVLRELLGEATGGAAHVRGLLARLARNG